jgi:small subunit ribosomal protein S21
MLIVDVQPNENIDKALKRFKRKFQRAQVMQELRRRQEFSKPSVRRRNEKLKAVFREKKKREVELL